jgi:hypothetical protein
MPQNRSDMNETNYNYEDLTNKKISRLYLHFIVVFVPFGILFNSLAGAIFCRPKLKSNSICFLYVTLIICDTFSLIWSFVVYKYLPTIGIDFSIYSKSACSLFVLLSRVAQHAPAFIQVFITLNQYIRVKYPLKKVKYFSKKKYLLVEVMLIYMLVAIANVENVFRRLQVSSEINATADPKSTSNSANASFSKACIASSRVSISADLVSSMMRTFIPFTIMLVLNLLMIRTLRLSKLSLKRSNLQPRLSTSNSASTANYSISFRRERILAVNLVMLNLIFFLFNFPLSITYILTNLFKYYYKLSNSTSSFMSELNYIHSIANSLAYVYCSMSFFTNLAFNSLFRKEIVAMLKNGSNQAKTNSYVLLKLKAKEECRLICSSS